MNLSKFLNPTLALTFGAGIVIGAGGATSQGLSVNYDRLSFVEEPIARSIAGFTVTYNQLFDIPLTRDLRDGKTDVAPRTVFELQAERQLPNAVTIGATYTGAAEPVKKGRARYNDAWAAYARNKWGTVFGGETTDLVREDTRRFRSVGNAELKFDDFIGRADKMGAGYSGTFSAFKVTAAGDRDGRYEVGLSYNRPFKYVDCRVTARYVSGEFERTDGRGTVKSDGFGGVYEVVYGNIQMDVGYGYERFDGALSGEDRKFLSIGANYKLDQLTLSVEGHVGRLSGYNETSWSVGGRYDIARGLSLNLGYDYSNMQAGFVEDAGKKHTTKVSTRYEF